MVIQKLREWTPECDEGLCYAVQEDRDEIAAGVNAGRLECYRLWGGEAYMVTRCMDNVLTVCCYQGGRLKEAGAWVLDQARKLGIAEVRFHTQNPAVARLARPLASWQTVETVYGTRLGGMH